MLATIAFLHPISVDTPQQQLEQLISTFFNSSLPYEQKKDAEHHLMLFKKQQNAWDLCRPLMHDGQNEEVIWFCLSVCEELVTQKWSTLSPQDRLTVKNQIIELFMQSAKSLKPMVLNKLLQTICDIARREWPHNFAELFPMVQTLIFDREARIIGLKLLKMISEEFISTKTDLSTARRAELKSHFLQHTTVIIESMRQILEDAYETPSRFPLSAHTFASYDSLADLRPNLHMNALSAGGSSFQLCQSPRGTFDSETIEICRHALEILIQLFSWIPLVQNVTLPVVNTILKYVQLNDAATVDLGKAAMSCVNEILARNCMPQEFQEYLFLIFRNVFEVLKYLSNDEDSGIIDDLDDEYRMKFTEFVSAFIHLHIHRFENDPNFPMGAFLEMLYKFTYNQPSVEALQDCLVIWNTFFDYLQLSKERGCAIHEKYKSGLLAFNLKLAQKVQFSTNASELSCIEDDIENSQGQTDYDLFINEWVDMLAKLAEFYPDEIVGFMVGLLNEHMNAFSRAVTHQRNESHLEELAQIGFIFKDLKASIRAFGRLSDLFVKSFQGTFELVYTMINNFHQVLDLCFKNYEKFKDLPDFLKIMIEAFSVQRAYVNWLETYKTFASQDAIEVQQRFDNLLSNCVNWCLVCFKREMPSQLCVVGSQVVKAVCITVRPRNLFTYPNVEEVLGNLHHTSVILSKEAKQNLYQACSSACLTILPETSHLSEGDLLSQYRLFVSGLTNPYVQLFQANLVRDNLHTRPEVRAQLLHVVEVITALVEGADAEKHQTKQVLYEAVKETIPCTIDLYQQSKGDSDMRREIMSFILAIFSALKKQLSKDVINQVVDSFVADFSKDNICELMKSSKNIGTEFLIQFIQLLTLMVCDNSRAYEDQIPKIVAFTIDRAPSVMHRTDNDASESLQSVYFPLIQSILVHQWKYFFPRFGINRATQSHAAAVENTEKFQQFVQLLHPVILSFGQPSLTIFRNNMVLLDELNSKCRLYQEESFKTKLMPAFINSLMLVLVEKSHDLLRDEIVNTMFTMCTANSNLFYQSFLLEFLRSSGVPSNHQHEIASYLRPVEDSPTFAEQIGRFIDDISFYRRS